MSEVYDLMMIAIMTGRELVDGLGNYRRVARIPSWGDIQWKTKGWGIRVDDHGRMIKVMKFMD